ncbi:l-ascorbate oxidase-like protein [Hordeum vulgare]|nr:l-ascorbate oxidase-like protein [Hordeum vulgare]
MPDPPPVMPAPLLSGHTEGTALEFVVRLREPPYGRLRLPPPFARVMEVKKPHGMWLRVQGCCNGTVYADVEYPTHCVMFLRRGWKIFVHAHNFMAGHVLRFKLVEADMLSVKIYGDLGSRLGCCEESSSDAESSSSSDSNEEGSANDDGDIKPPAVKSEYDGSGSS